MTIEVLDRSSGARAQSPLTIGDGQRSCRVKMEIAPGASSLRVVVRADAGVLAWIEVPAQQGEQLAIDLILGPSGELRAFCRNRDFLFFPCEEPPEPALLCPATTDDLDLVVLVDGTALHPTGMALDYLLSPGMGEPWNAIVNQILEFVSALASRYPKLWAMACAFGDEPMEMLSNPELRPSYVVEPEIPEERKLQPLTPAALASQLRELRATPGGDLVDALANGLRACRQAQWRQNSRKLLLLFGNSPGYSVLDPGGDMGSLLVREPSLEEETAALHKAGIEVVTIYHDPAQAEEMFSSDAEEVLRLTGEQYQRLASLPEWRSTTSALDLERVRQAWLRPPAVMARGAAPGFLVE